MKIIVLKLFMIIIPIHKHVHKIVVSCGIIMISCARYVTPLVSLLP